MPRHRTSWRISCVISRHIPPVNFWNCCNPKNKPESRREWLLYLFRCFARKLRGTQEHQIWQHDNHPIALFTEKVTVQKLRYIHANPVRAKWVRRPEDWIYSSASNYAEGQGVFDVKLLWVSFDEDGGWFFGNVDAPTLD